MTYIQRYNPATGGYDVIDIEGDFPSLVPGASRVLGPFPFSFDDEGLENGIEFYTPTVGDVLLDAWVVIDEAFDDAPVFGDIGFLGDGNNGGGFFGDQFNPLDMTKADDIDSGSTVGGGVKLGSQIRSLSDYSVLYNAGAQQALLQGEGTSLDFNQYSASSTMPWIITEEDPLSIWVNQTGYLPAAACECTVGRGAVYLVVATPSLT